MRARLGEYAIAYKVSIRARHCWRAMHDVGRALQHVGHVSIRARHCWRAMPAAGCFDQTHGSVSIRARHCWRAMLRAWQGWEAAEGVSIRARHCWRAMPGRCTACRRRHPVSIRARHCWRAMRRCGADREASSEVSIRARHCWRAMPLPSRLVLVMPSGFNPRPPLLAGDATLSVMPSRMMAVFQSAPAIAGGRCSASSSLRPM